MLKQIVNQYNEAIMDTDRDKALLVVHDALELGITPEEQLEKAINRKTREPECLR